jgi:hypothetical protein
VGIVPLTPVNEVKAPSAEEVGVPVEWKVLLWEPAGLS